jgi:uncharacterized protein
MRVWIDLSNSPHPPLFAPLSRLLDERGHEVLVTARNHAQTVALAREHWPGVAVVGGESGPGRAAKARLLADRIRALRSWARAHQPDVALSHNSYAQVGAARAGGIRAVTAMDFEYQPANHLAFRLANLVLLPEAVPRRIVRRQGARDAKVRRYPGLKEGLYVGDFEPDPAALSRLGVDPDREHPVVVIRTPPSGAIYHRFNNELFVPALRQIARQPQVRGVILARHRGQRRTLEELALPNCVIPDAAVDARSLMYQADLVLGAGGTMTREAALMGVPTLSLYAGRVPAVDRWLEKRGALARLTSPEQIAAIRPRPSGPAPLGQLRRLGDAPRRVFIEAVVNQA